MTVTSPKHQITDGRLLFAGSAVFTVENADGEHYTYKVSRVRKVKLLYGDEDRMEADLAKLKGGRRLHPQEIYGDRYESGLECGWVAFQETDGMAPDEVDAPMFVSYLRDAHGGNALDDRVYSYMGVWDEKRKRLRTTKRSRAKVRRPWKGQWVNELDWNTVATLRKYDNAPECPQVLAVFLWTVHMMVNDRPMPDGYGVYHMGRCMRCGRDLTEPESIKSGLGPYCRGKVFG